MDNNINKEYGEIKVTDRKKTTLSGVKKLVSFNPEEFLIETTLGVILLKGSELEIVKLDTVDGILSIKGRVNSINYMDANKKSDTSLIARLFK
ncbi:MAG: sporulation protein YabP [Bacilli bacterium]|nr:sporulation protein YabP [Bacilli bacterium]